MKYLKFSQYIYLVASVFFLYSSISSWDSDKNHAYLSLFLFVLAVFMFIFKRRFYKKHEAENNNK